MTVAIAPELVDPVVRGLIGGIDVGDGPTEEQLNVLAAVVGQVWGRPDIDLKATGGLGPDELAAAVTDPVARRRFYEILVTLEMCRHPLDDAQVSRVEQYSAAIGLAPRELEIFRDLIDQGAKRAAADFSRYFDDMIMGRSEERFKGMPIQKETPEPEIVRALEGFADLPDDSLGRAFLNFYERNNLELPGVRASTVNHMYVAHDFIHVLSGIEPTGPGEIGLGAFQMAMDDNPVNAFAFLSPIIVHETGISGVDNIVVTEGALSRPGAIDLLGESFARGSAVTGDFAAADHFAIAAMPLDEVRAQYGVRPPASTTDGWHIW